MLAAKLKTAKQLTAPPRGATRKPAAPARSAATPLRTDDLTKRPVSELEELAAAQRKVLESRPNDEIARRNLSLIAIVSANRILEAEAHGRATDAASLVSLLRNSLNDTFWRTTQLVHDEPARAQAALGLFYGEGILVTADANRSCDYFSKAANAGQNDAAFRASMCLAQTQPKLAQQFLEQAAIGGNPAAEERMGRSCIEGGAFDADCAKIWLQSAAAQGRVSAISVLAWLYVREGSAQSLAEAGKLYQTAAEAGDFAAQNNLGEFFETGRGLAKDPQQAFNWYRKSAEGGFAPGQFNLARLYAFGLGTTRDTAAARDWAFKAQAQGVAKAAELLRIISDAQARGEP